MKPEATNYTPAKAHRELPVPTTCRVGRSSRELKIGDDGKGQAIHLVACDEALICDRCHKCLHHCECAGGLRVADPPPIRRKKGADPARIAERGEKIPGSDAQEYVAHEMRGAITPAVRAVAEAASHTFTEIETQESMDAELTALRAQLNGAGEELVSLRSRMVAITEAAQYAVGTLEAYAPNSPALDKLNAALSEDTRLLDGLTDHPGWNLRQVTNLDWIVYESQTSSVRGIGKTKRDALRAAIAREGRTTKTPQGTPYTK